MAALTVRRLFTVDEYERMIEAGILTEDDRVELLEGEIVELSPIGPSHSSCVNQLTRLLTRVTPEDLLVAVQNPIRLYPRSMPQPDLAVLRPGDFRARHPGPDDIVLVIEVADTTLAEDRGVKLPAYGKAGVAEAWMIDLNGGIVERHTDPGAAGYRLIQRATAGERLTSTTLPSLTFGIDDVAR